MNQIELRTPGISKRTKSRTMNYFVHLERLQNHAKALEGKGNGFLTPIELIKSIKAINHDGIVKEYLKKEKQKFVLHKYKKVK